jgi:hypothetical protein
VRESGEHPAIRQLGLLARAAPTAGPSDGDPLRRIGSTGREVTAVAFEALAHRHGPMVLATRRGALRDEHDAEQSRQLLPLHRRAAEAGRPDTTPNLKDMP